MAHSPVLNATVTLTDIARFANVNRPAVSNWRRRTTNFPEPAGGTATRPQFRLTDIEKWAKEQGKHLSITEADRFWFNLAPSSPDPTALVADIGHLLTDDPAQSNSSPLASPENRAQLTRLTDHHPPADLFEFFLERAADGDNRSSDHQELSKLAAITAPSEPEGTLHDPNCHDGDSLLAIAQQLPDTNPLTEIAGSDADPIKAAIAATRLKLNFPDTHVTCDASASIADPDPFTERFSLIVCRPPNGFPNWETPPLGSATPYVYGTPPRVEHELAWAQLCLRRTKPGGVALMVMPQLAAYRRSGRRIRAALLRQGALRAVVSLNSSKSHVWVLQHPDPQTPPTQMLLSDGEDLESTWPKFRDAPGTALATAHSRTVPLVRLLDETVDVAPQSHLTAGELSADDIVAEAAQLRELLAHEPSIPEFTLVSSQKVEAPPSVPLGDLEETWGLEIHLGPASLGETAGVKVAFVAGAATTSIGSLGSVEPGEVAVTTPPNSIDAGWLAALLTAQLTTSSGTSSSTGKHKLRAVRVPQIPLVEQQKRGAAFRKLLVEREHLSRASAALKMMTLSAATGLAGGTVRAKDEESL